MIRLPPGSTRTYTHFPYTTLVRSRGETARDGGEEPLLALDVGGDRPEHWRLELIGAVGAPEALDRGVCLPAGLQQIVNAQAPVPGTEVGVVAAPGAAGIGEEEDASLVVHDGLRLRSDAPTSELQS